MSGRFGRAVGRAGCLARAALAVGALTVGAAGCGPKPSPTNVTFFNTEAQPGGAGADNLEWPYPPLDLKPPAPLTAIAGPYKGVYILGGGARFSRPWSWHIRRASLQRDNRYVEYVSPSGYLLSIYERGDNPGDAWRDVMARYQEDVKAKGGELVGGGVPYASLTTQGRRFVVKRSIKGQRGAYQNYSEEALMRGKGRVVLVEIVHEGQSIEPIESELTRVVDTLEIL
jgi:hypothetical protein